MAAVPRPTTPAPDPRPSPRAPPTRAFPYPWSVYRWLDGEPAREDTIGDLGEFANALAGFLAALQRVDSDGGPEPGRHNWFRGAPLATYADEAVQAIEALGAEIPREAVARALGRRDGDDLGAATRSGSTATSRSGTCSCATAGWRQ